MKYFDGIDNTEASFPPTFKSITNEDNMKIFVYEYKRWLWGKKPDVTETIIDRIITRAIFYHCGWFQYGKNGTDTMRFMTSWTNALYAVLHEGYVPPVAIAELPTYAGRRLELLITGD